jgi:hypothetical protein
MFLNLKGREANGIVEPGAEAAALKKEIAAKLRNLLDEETATVGVNEAFDTAFRPRKDFDSFSTISKFMTLKSRAALPGRARCRWAGT